MTIKLSRKEELKEKFRIIRESKWLTFGILIGILGSLIAGIINDLVKNTIYYPWTYLLILILIFLILIYKCIKPYLGWRIYQYKMDKWMKKAKRILNKK